MSLSLEKCRSLTHGWKLNSWKWFSKPFNQNYCRRYLVIFPLSISFPSVVFSEIFIWMSCTGPSISLSFGMVVCECRRHHHHIRRRRHFYKTMYRVGCTGTRAVQCSLNRIFVARMLQPLLLQVGNRISCGLWWSTISNKCQFVHGRNTQWDKLLFTTFKRFQLIWKRSSPAIQ